jgi:hypothetical protein
MATSMQPVAKNPSAGTASLKLSGGNSGVAIDPLAADVVTVTVALTMDVS